MLDADQDERIGKVELVNAAAQEGSPDFVATVERVFTLSDVDEDGSLDRRGAERFMKLLDRHATVAGWVVDGDDADEAHDEDDEEPEGKVELAENDDA
mmetsp:Transcript_101812/g.294631  ORF Transcript_101812/g.294631 Transcript_101812/m.294631 type:complete len:98 (+) Transcript_101812:3-296(+)